MAPGLDSKDTWQQWLLAPTALSSDLPKIPLKQIPPMLRRRFSDLGRCAAGAALPLLGTTDAIPSVFASRHGDTHLTLSLLEGIAKNEDMSPTGFSLAVHNAVSGLLSIARKDVSQVTAIASADNLVAHALIEAAVQLQEHPEVLCIIYDVPLPELYQPYVESLSYPCAIAMILSQSEGADLCIQAESLQSKGVTSKHVTHEAESVLRFLSGYENEVLLGASESVERWRLTQT